MGDAGGACDRASTRGRPTAARRRAVIVFGIDPGSTVTGYGVVERARKALEGNDVTALKTSNDAVGKTLNMFKGVVQKIG